MKRIAIVALLAAVVSPGCVAKKMFGNYISGNDRRVSEVEGGVEANQRRIEDLRDSTDARVRELESTSTEAYERAEGAERLAEEAVRGKLLWTVTLSDDRVKFPFGQSGLSNEARQQLDQLADEVKSYGKALYLEIEGHTDDVGDAEFNRELGERRALAVRSYLSERGLPLHAMNTISFGEAQPVADNGSADGRSKNRRVLVRVLE